MKKNINQFVPVTPKTYTVAELGDQQIKQSPLSPVAQSKVIRRWGGGYRSERADEVNPGYGPMPSNSSNSFTLTISIHGDSYNKYAFETSGATFSTCTFNSVDDAFMWVVKLGKGEVKVVDTKQNNKRNTELEEKMKEDIKKTLAEFLTADLKEGEGRGYELKYLQTQTA